VALTPIVAGWIGSYLFLARIPCVL
jgi:hypothetical protein